MIRGQGLGIEHVERGAGDPARLQRLDQRRLIDDRAARRIDQPCRRLHERELGGAHQSDRAPTEDEMDGDDVGLAEQRVLVDERRASGAGDLAGEILTPGDHRHAEGEGDPGNLLADIAQPDHAEALAPQVCADARLPAAIADRGGFAGEVARAGEDESPGELDGRRGFIAGRGHELSELRICHFVLVHPERIDLHSMGGPLIRPSEFGVSAHRELAAGNPDHVGWR